MFMLNNLERENKAKKVEKMQGRKMPYFSVKFKKYKSSCKLEISLCSNHFED